VRLGEALWGIYGGYAGICEYAGLCGDLCVGLGGIGLGGASLGGARWGSVWGTRWDSVQWGSAAHIFCFIEAHVATVTVNY
jgi:hypothetical protein